MWIWNDVRMKGNVRKSEVESSNSIWWDSLLFELDWNVTCWFGWYCLVGCELWVLVGIGVSYVIVMYLNMLNCMFDSLNLMYSIFAWLNAYWVASSPFLGKIFQVLISLLNSRSSRAFGIERKGWLEGHKHVLHFGFGMCNG